VIARWRRWRDRRAYEKALEAATEQLHLVRATQPPWIPSVWIALVLRRRRIQEGG
jgi:hypothetical protein